MALRIESEEQAWDLIERALDGGLDLDESEPLVLDFSGWPVVDVYLPDTPQGATISPTMMEAFIELQRAIYRSYTLVESDTADLRTLSKAEKDKLEFRVKVRDGSSGYMVDLSAVLERIGIEVVTKLDQSGIIICVLGVATLLAGASVWRANLASKVDTRKAELDDAEKQRWLEAQKAALDASTKHMEILARAKEVQPLLSDVDAMAEPSKMQMVRAVGEEGRSTSKGQASP